MTWYMHNCGHNFTDMIIKDQRDLMFKVMQLENIKKDIITKQLKDKRNNYFSATHAS